MSATCRTCNAPVLWVVNELTGRRMPLDPAPDSIVEGTRFVLTGEMADSYLSASREHAPVARTAVAGEMGRRSHFASCPDAAEHRRAR